MAGSSTFLTHRPCPYTFRSFSTVPTILALVTSFLILRYVTLTSPLFSRRHLPHRASFHSSKQYPSGPPSASHQIHHGLSYNPVHIPFEEHDSHDYVPSSANIIVNLSNGSSPSKYLLTGKGVIGDIYHNKELFLQDYTAMKQSFKIYVYPTKTDDPFAHALLPVKYAPGGNYASESYFKRVLMQSHFVTQDPSQADLFFLPFSIASLRYDPRVSVGGLSDYVRNYLSHINQKYPFWNRSGGADHFYVACHSAGRSAMNKAEKVQFNAIQVVCSSNYFVPGYVAHKDASMPQIWPRKGEPAGVSSLNRKKLAFFAGTVNSNERKRILQTWGNDSEMHVYSGRLPTSYADELLGSKFCLHVKGFEVNTARIADSLFYGCVPVIIADHYDLPFTDVLNWKGFSLVVPSSDIPRLKDILHRKSSQGLFERLHKNVLKVRKHFQWHPTPKDFDAFHMVMYELWLRRSVARVPLT